MFSYVFARPRLFVPIPQEAIRRFGSVVCVLGGSELSVWCLPSHSRCRCRCHRLRSLPPPPLWTKTWGVLAGMTPASQSSTSCWYGFRGNAGIYTRTLWLPPPAPPPPTPPFRRSSPVERRCVVCAGVYVVVNNLHSFSGCRSVVVFTGISFAAFDVYTSTHSHTRPFGIRTGAVVGGRRHAKSIPADTSLFNGFAYYIINIACAKSTSRGAAAYITHIHIYIHTSAWVHFKLKLRPEQKKHSLTNE